jgi:UDP-N-acetylmuramate--alanine ligase
MRLEDIHSVYLVGIGGIGMSALARWFHHRGCFVAGYDRVSTPLTQKLESEGLVIHYEDSVSLIPEKVLGIDKRNVLVIYTPAIPKDHKEYNYLVDEGYEVLKRSEVLGVITSSQYAIGVAGTHGKTTTSSIIAHILDQSDKGCNAFVGGIMTNTESNLIVGDKDAPVVVEADEFDRSFLRLHPNIAVVTSVDPDHLDIYGDDASVKESFGEYIKKTNSSGKILVNANAIEKLKSVETGAEKITYGLDQGEIQGSNLRVEDGAFVFDYSGVGTDIKDVKLHLPGYHNVENTVAAITVALWEGLGPEEIKNSIGTYKGVKRRFEYILRTDRVTFIDDYAHHPSEIQALLRSVRFLFPGKKVLTIFQPHLFTRTRDFVDGFAEELSKSDELVLLPIYPARELPIEGVTSQMILDRVSNANSEIVEKENLIERIGQSNADVVLTVGAGDIDQLVPIVAEYLRKEVNGVEL